MCKSKERGSALITVILVVLVLTMVGLASLFYMTTEERISSVARLEKAAFYAAEVGLRRAERSLTNQATQDSDIISTLLAYETPMNNQWSILHVPPSGGTTHQTAIPFTDTIDPDLQNPREDLAVKLIDPDNAGVPITEMRGILVDDQGYITTYSVYVRNDGDESDEIIDSNNRISLLSVGLLVTPTGQIVRKILEEDIAPVGAGSAPPLFQKNFNQMGTSAS